MRINDRELRYAIKSADSKAILHEGLLVFSDLKEGQKPRMVKLIGSLLALFRVSSNGVISEVEPAEVIILTDCMCKPDPSLNSTNFHIISPGSPYSSSYTFQCKIQQDRDDWLSALHHSSYLSLQQQLVSLKSAVQEAHSRKVNNRSANHHPAHKPLRQSPAIPVRLSPSVKSSRPAPELPGQTVTQSLSQASSLAQPPMINTNTKADLESIFGIAQPQSVDFFGHGAEFSTVSRSLSFSDPFSIRQFSETQRPIRTTTHPHDISPNATAKDDDTDVLFSQSSSLVYDSLTNHNAGLKSNTQTEPTTSSEDLLIDFS